MFDSWIRIPRSTTGLVASSTQGVFVTAQSIATFPVATGAIAAVKAIATKLPVLASQNITLAIIAAVAYGVFLISISMPTGTVTPRARNIAIGVGVINTISLVAIAVGV